jgi:hypothetical protein
MPSFGIVEQDIILDLAVQIDPVIGRVEIYLLPLERSPEPFDVDIVQRPVFTIHGDLYLLVPKNL